MSARAVKFIYRFLSTANCTFLRARPVNSAQVLLTTNKLSPNILTALLNYAERQHECVGGESNNLYGHSKPDQL